MVISLDTSELKKVRIRIDDGTKIKRLRYAAYADSALPRIIKAMNGKKPKVVGVVAGPGAFSATRTGVALMNALAYGFDIPIIALNQAQFDSSEPLPPSSARPPIAVRYGMPPNITKKKIQ